MPSSPPRSSTRVALAVLVVLAGSAASGASAAECWAPPVPGPVTDPYREPACRWCPGNRGMEFATPPGTPVRAVRSGVVTFSGSVAGTRYVVVEHPNGWRATYGDLAEHLVARGDVVLGGTAVGSSGRRLHFGLRDGERYLDPAPYLGRRVFPVRLVPVDGSPPVDVGPGRLECGQAPDEPDARRVGSASSHR